MKKERLFWVKGRSSEAGKSLGSSSKQKEASVAGVHEQGAGDKGCSWREADAITGAVGRDHISFSVPVQPLKLKLHLKARTPERKSEIRAQGKKKCHQAM